MKKLSLLFLTVILGIGVFAQTTVYWRANGPSDGKWLWGSTCEAAGDGQWFYNLWGGFRQGPNCFGNHDVYFDGNGINSMDLNGGSDFGVRSIIFTSNATDSRTLNANTADNRTLWLNANNGNPKIENNSSATHTFNAPISYSANVELKPVSGDLTFTKAINNNGNWTDVWGGNGKTLSIASMSGTGGLTIKSNPTTVIITGTSTYTGITYVDFGTLELQADVSSAEIIVANGAKLVIKGTDVDIQKLIINSGGTVEVAADKSLTVNGNFVNNGTFTIKSGATVKTVGTVTGSGTTNIEQSLGDNRSWWYLSSPVSAATSSIFSSDQVGKHVEDYVNDNDEATTAPYYTAPFSSPESLTAGRGYVIKRAVTTEAIYTFTGGSLNTGDVSPTVTCTGTTAVARGFNLVGNPYPSYLDWDAVYTSLPTNHNMRNAIWFRTYSGGNMTFHTYGDGDASPEITSPLIAPMQAFWVKVATDGNNGSLTFKNTHRKHFETGANPLKVKALDARPRLRLVVSNGTATDEMLVVGKSYASDVLDSYDIEKYPNDNVAIPEIYSMVSGQELVINSMNELTEGKTVTLGFRPGQAGTFTIEATQLDNIDAKIILVDKVAVKEQELTAETPYTFESDGTETNDRFLIKLVSKVPTDVESNTANGDLTVYVNRNNRIQLICGLELNEKATVSVYNVAGQKLSTQKLSKAATELNGTFTPGVYMIQLTNGSQAITKKLIIR